VTDGPILYDELASWWPLLSAPSDYEEEATLYAGRFSEYASLGRRSLLELGSGGGSNASHLKTQLAFLRRQLDHPAMTYARSDESIRGAS